MKLNAVTEPIDVTKTKPSSDDNDTEIRLRNHDMYPQYCTNVAAIKSRVF